MQIRRHQVTWRLGTNREERRSVCSIMRSTVRGGRWATSSYSISRDGRAGQRRPSATVHLRSLLTFSTKKGGDWDGEGKYQKVHVCTPAKNYQRPQNEALGKGKNQKNYTWCKRSPETLLLLLLPAYLAPFPSDVPIVDADL